MVLSAQAPRHPTQSPRNAQQITAIKRYDAILTPCDLSSLQTPHPSSELSKRLNAKTFPLSLQGGGVGRPPPGPLGCPTCSGPWQTAPPHAPRAEHRCGASCRPRPATSQFERFRERSHTLGLSVRLTKLPPHTAPNATLPHGVARPTRTRCNRNSVAAEQAGCLVVRDRTSLGKVEPFSSFAKGSKGC